MFSRDLYYILYYMGADYSSNFLHEHVQSSVTGYGTFIQRHLNLLSFFFFFCFLPLDISSLFARPVVFPSIAVFLPCFLLLFFLFFSLKTITYAILNVNNARPVVHLLEINNVYNVLSKTRKKKSAWQWGRVDVLKEYAFFIIIIQYIVGKPCRTLLRKFT